MTDVMVPDSITVTVDGSPRTILMTFGLLHEVTKHVNDIALATLVSVDPNLRSAVLEAVLSSRDEHGNITKKFNPFTNQVSSQDVIALSAWAGGHALAFFLNSLRSGAEMGKMFEKELESLMPSQSGSGG